MTKRTRRNHSAAFKAKVALAAVKGDKTLADLHDHLRTLESDPDRDALFADIRRLIEKVIVTPTGARKPVALEVHRLLASLLFASVGDPGFRGMDHVPANGVGALAEG